MTGLIERLQELKKEFDGASATLKNGMALKLVSYNFAIVTA